MFRHKLTLSVILLLLFACADNQEVSLKNFQQEGSKQIKSLAMQLKKELSSAMQSGGPSKAVNTCNTQAPIITNNLNLDSSIKVKRTSLKFRNPENAPDAWEKKTLELFEQQLNNGKPISELVYSEKIEKNNTSTLRMMKAIPTQGICITCHGIKETLPNELVGILKEHYPNDLATGYSVGDLRGAFSLTQTLKK